jgi:hypothetical protein
MTCIICLSPVTLPTLIVPCGHGACAQCIVAWYLDGPKPTPHKCVLCNEVVDSFLVPRETRTATLHDNCNALESDALDEVRAADARLTEYAERRRRTLDAKTRQRRHRIGRLEREARELRAKLASRSDIAPPERTRSIIAHFAFNDLGYREALSSADIVHVFGQDALTKQFQVLRVLIESVWSAAPHALNVQLYGIEGISKLVCRMPREQVTFVIPPRASLMPMLTVYEAQAVAPLTHGLEAPLSRETRDAFVDVSESSILGKTLALNLAHVSKTHKVLYSALEQSFHVSTACVAEIVKNFSVATQDTPVIYLKDIYMTLACRNSATAALQSTVHIAVRIDVLV